MTLRVDALRGWEDLMARLQELARQYIEQRYFIGPDGLLYTPVGRAARSEIRIGHTIFSAALVVEEMQRQKGESA